MGKNYKLFTQIRHDSGERIAMDIRDKEKKEKYQNVDKFDKDLFERGVEYGSSGLSIEDAPEDMRTNTNFIRGFEKGQRLNLIASLQQNDSKRR